MSEKGQGQKEDDFPSSGKDGRKIRSDSPKVTFDGPFEESSDEMDVSHLSEMERISRIMKIEMRCPICGIKHPNPSLINSYRYCFMCNMVLAEAEEIVEDRIPPSAAPLRILAAAYGHPTHPAHAVDCTQHIMRRVEGRGARDRLVIRRAEDLRTWLGDPCPGQPKVLRIRYSIKDVRGEVWLKENEDEEGHVQRDLDIMVPKRPPVVILLSAFYGHPRGPQNGRWCFNVKEFLQARLDESGGYNIRITHDENLHEIFGDPSEGREKDFVMKYEILGTAGKVHCQVIDGKLRSNIFIRSTPILMPLILIHKATYGMSDEDIEERMRKIYNDLMNLIELERRHQRGLKLTYFDETSLKKIPELKEKLVAASEAKVEFKDVRDRLQRCIEAELGRRLVLRKDTTDINKLLGYNPCEGYPKVLRIEYSIIGHDSEKITSSNEITSSGFQRNFISHKKGTCFVDVEDDENGTGVLAEDIIIEAKNVLPVIEVNAATFGHPVNLSKCFDVGAQIKCLVEKQGGNTLEIAEGTDLVALFRDPCRGVRKRLTISYVARGLNGTVRVPDINGHLASDVFVGHPIPENAFEDRSVWTSAGSVQTPQPSLEPISVELKSRALNSRKSQRRVKAKPSTPADFFDSNIESSFKDLQIEGSITSESRPVTGSRTPASSGRTPRTAGTPSTLRKNSFNTINTYATQKSVRIKEDPEVQEDLTEAGLEFKNMSKKERKAIKRNKKKVKHKSIHEPGLDMLVLSHNQSNEYDIESSPNFPPLGMIERPKTSGKDNLKPPSDIERPGTSNDSSTDKVL